MLGISTALLGWASFAITLATSLRAQNNVEKVLLGNTEVTVITTTHHGTDPDFPSSTLLSTLLGPPASDGTGGLNLVPDLLFSANSAIPSRYAIKTVGQGTAETNNLNCGCAASQGTTTHPCSSNI